MQYVLSLSTGAELEMTIPEDQYESLVNWMTGATGTDIASIGDVFVNRHYIVMVKPIKANDTKELEDEIADKLFKDILASGKNTSKE